MVLASHLMTSVHSPLVSDLNNLFVSLISSPLPICLSNLNKPLGLLTFNLTLSSLFSSHFNPLLALPYPTLTFDFRISLSTSDNPTFLARQWSVAPPGTSRFSTQLPTLWTFAGRLPRAGFRSTGWSTLLWLEPGSLSRWVSNHCGGSNAL